MKTTFRILFVILSAGFLFTSCQKTSDKQNASGDPRTENSVNPILTPEYRQALLNIATEKVNQQSGERGAEFLPIFFTQTAFFFFDEALVNLVTVSTELDDNDFLRENPDGTYSVHISSDDAICELFSYENFGIYYGEHGHMTMNYSGPAELVAVYDFEGNLLGYIYEVIPNEDSPATVWHGTGTVELLPFGPEFELNAKMMANAGWKKVKRTIVLE